MKGYALAKKNIFSQNKNMESYDIFLAWTSYDHTAFCESLNPRTFNATVAYLPILSDSLIL